MKNTKPIITGGFGNINDLDIINILNELDPVFHKAPSPCAPVSRAIRDRMFLALVSARIEEFGRGMPGWEEGRRGDFDEKGYFGTQQIRGNNN